ncbi:hypothetical protein ACUH93_00635 [Dermabacteraceae bacterium P7006]
MSEPETSTKVVVRTRKDGSEYACLLCEYGILQATVEYDKETSCVFLEPADTCIFEDPEVVMTALFASGAVNDEVIARAKQRAEQLRGVVGTEDAQKEGKE